jgi:multidrug resistance efflux pump
MEDTRKQYLLASNTESLQTLIEKQKDELTRVLIELKSEYDLLTRETNTKKQLIEEYNKKINMIQHANNVNEKRQEEKKESTNIIKEGIELKKNKKNEELYTKKTLSKQVDKLNKDLFIIQKEIIKQENESVLLDKKKRKSEIGRKYNKRKRQPSSFKNRGAKLEK